VAGWVVGLVLLLASGCTSACCEPERLPHAGRAETPEALFDLVKHAGYNGCDDLLYDLMSAKTHEALGRMSRLKFSSFWDSDQAIVYPPPYRPDESEVFVYTLAEVIRGQAGKADDDGPCEPPPVKKDGDSTPYGAVLDSVDDGTPPHVRIKVAYERPWTDKSKQQPTNVRFHLLVVPETTEDGHTEWRLGVVEQLAHPELYGEMVPEGEVTKRHPKRPRRKRAAHASVERVLDRWKRAARFDLRREAARQDASAERPVPGLPPLRKRRGALRGARRFAFS